MKTKEKMVLAKFYINDNRYEFVRYVDGKNWFKEWNDAYYLLKTEEVDVGCLCLQSAMDKNIIPDTRG